ncbi:MAG: DnaJ domain-containing protein [Campylobacteraceae bacterium]|nr:DnaJ domain-containing protein [Campylobacteraceae bacterium]
MKKSEAISAALEVLALPIYTTINELKSHYHLLALKAHPDCGGSEEEMAKINEAYAIIKDYMEQFKFTFSEEEINKQFPQELHVNRFRF